MSLEHWQCVLCGLRSQIPESSECRASGSRLLRVHDWRDAFELAHDEGVLVWEYSSDEEFRKARKAIQDAGWVVDHAESKRHTASGRLPVLGSIASLAKPKATVATLRRRERRQTEGWTTASLLEPRMTKGRPPSNSPPRHNAKSKAEDGKDGEPFPPVEFPQNGDDQHDGYQDVDGSSTYTQDASS